MRSKLNIICLCFLFLIKINTYFAYANTQSIANSISEYLNTTKIRSTYYIATNKDQLIAQGASGYFSCVSKTDELEVSTAMPIASVTKSMTAAAIMRLHEQNKIQLEDTIDQHIPKDYWPNNTPPSWSSNITIHQLLTHSSGLSDYIWYISCNYNMSTEDIKKHVLKTIADQPLMFTPGQDYKYCNSGYFILGIIIECVSNRESRDFFQNEFFTPLGMNNTYLLDFHKGFEMQVSRSENKIPEGCIVLIDRKPSAEIGEVALVKAPMAKLVPPFADGGVISNVLDLYKWNVALHNGKVVSEESYAKMTTPHIKVTQQINEMFTDVYYGYGLHVASLSNGSKIYGHAGNFYNMRGEQWYIPSQGISISILSDVFIPKLSNYSSEINSKIKEKFDIKALLNFSLSQLFEIQNN